MLLCITLDKDENNLFRRPACVEKGCCFKCVSGLCPFGYDVFIDCFPHLSEEEKSLFMELIKLRSLIARKL